MNEDGPFKSNFEDYNLLSGIYVMIVSSVGCEQQTQETG
jgi:hypothetical protein